MSQVLSSRSTITDTDEFHLAILSYLSFTSISGTFLVSYTRGASVKFHAIIFFSEETKILNFNSLFRRVTKYDEDLDKYQALKFSII